MRKTLFLENISVVQNQEDREANSRTCVRMCVCVGGFCAYGIFSLFSADIHF